MTESSEVMIDNVDLGAVETSTPAVALSESLGFRRLARREVAPGVWSAQFEHWHRRAREPACSNSVPAPAPARPLCR